MANSHCSFVHATIFVSIYAKTAHRKNDVRGRSEKNVDSKPSKCPDGKIPPDSKIPNLREHVPEKEGLSGRPRAPLRKGVLRPDVSAALQDGHKLRIRRNGNDVLSVLPRLRLEILNEETSDFVIQKTCADDDAREFDGTVVDGNHLHASDGDRVDFDDREPFEMRFEIPLRTVAQVSGRHFRPEESGNCLNVLGFRAVGLGNEVALYERPGPFDAEQLLHQGIFFGSPKDVDAGYALLGNRRLHEGHRRFQSDPFENFVERNASAVPCTFAHGNQVYALAIRIHDTPVFQENELLIRIGKFRPARDGRFVKIPIPMDWNRTDSWKSFDDRENFGIRTGRKIVKESGFESEPDEVPQLGYHRPSMNAQNLRSNRDGNAGLVQFWDVGFRIEGWHGVRVREFPEVTRTTFSEVLKNVWNVAVPLGRYSTNGKCWILRKGLYAL